MSAALATRAGPRKKAMARPKALEVRAMAVAMVRSLWGNHVWWWKEGRGGARGEDGARAGRRGGGSGGGARRGKEGHIYISSSATNWYCFSRYS